MIKLNTIYKPKHKKLSITFLILFIMLVIYTIMLFMPVLWGFLQSLQNGDALFKAIPFPLDWKFSNYYTAFTKFYVEAARADGTITYPTMPYLFLYSFLYSCGCAFMATLIPCMVGYVTARFNYFFSKVINTFVIIAIALPIVGAQASELQMMRKFGLYNQMYGLWISKSHFLTIYYLIFYQRFRSLGQSFEEAAHIDGAGYFKCFTSIVMPIVSNLFFTVFLIQFITFWNDYYTPLMYMPAYPTLAYGMWWFMRNQDNILNNTPTRLAGGVLMLIPILIIYSIFNERLMINLTIGGDKE